MDKRKVEANNIIHILTKIDSNVTHVRGLDRLEYRVRLYLPSMPKNTVGDFVRNEKYPNRK
jgi:hypothetical protein